VHLTVIWTGEGEDQDGDWHAEFAEVELGPSGLRAAGVQLGAVPVPYRLEYRLDAGGKGFVTRSLEVETAGEGWKRRLRLDRDAAGTWSADVGASGEAGLPAPGGDCALLGDALDCDLALSPLTNAMPIHRHSLAGEPGELDFLMAWVSVPDLAFRPSRQRYTHLGRKRDLAVVRFLSLDDDEAPFESDLEFDGTGLVRRYPKLARRIHPTAEAAGHRGY
jgi:hypothetical protein